MFLPSADVTLTVIAGYGILGVNDDRLESHRTAQETPVPDLYSYVAVASVVIVRL